ncbi:K(+) efflux antiporter chloroplastic-like [Trifolium pratense]|uniref:K(+) efflux antiporter chloroplastic-like n=1 Tax=Trifolium pratense TaxID=57577 RepID=A0A2K3NEG9_TRIPR|nr:K(+) efflux antiporter chloroplastic-like [Trifolium pratense]
MNMDLGCSLPQSRILHGAVETSYRQKYVGQVGFLDYRRGFGCGFLGKSVLRSRFSVENKVSCVSSCWNDSKVVAGGEFKVLNTKRSMSCKNEKLLMGSRFIWLKCQGNDSLAYVNGNGRNVDYVEGSGEDAAVVPISSVELDVPVEEGGRAEKEIGVEEQSVDELKELLQKALKELEVAQINSTMFEEKVKKISETAIFLHDEAARSLNDVNSTLDTIQKVANEEHQAKEAVQNATMALSLAEARLQVVIESLEAAKEVHEGSNESDGGKDLTEKQSTLFVAQEDIKECQETLANCEVELRRLQNKKEELQNEASKLQEIAEKAQLDAVKAEENVTNIMLLAEQAVAFELEATQRVNDAEIALQRANKSFTNLNADTVETIQVQDVVLVSEEENNVESFSDDVTVSRDKDLATIDDASLLAKLSPETESEKAIQISEDTAQPDYISDSENAIQTKKQETQKDLTKDSSPFAPKALSKKSSRFFSASFFSFTEEEAESTPASVFQGLILSAKKQLPKLVLGLLLMGAGAAVYANRAEKNAQFLQQPDVIVTSAEEFSSNAKPLFRKLQKIPKKIKKIIASLPHQEVNEEEASLFDMLWLLLASVIFVPIFQKIPGGLDVLERM